MNKKKDALKSTKVKQRTIGSLGFAAERRRYRRRIVLDSFHVFLTVPKNGENKIYLKDISENGFAFESDKRNSFSLSQTLECAFYINAGLSVPLKVRVAHIRPLENGSKLTGVEVLPNQDKSHQALIIFVKLLDQLTKLEKSTS